MSWVDMFRASLAPKKKLNEDDRAFTVILALSIPDESSPDSNYQSMLWDSMQNALAKKNLPADSENVKSAMLGVAKRYLAHAQDNWGDLPVRDIYTQLLTYAMEEVMAICTASQKDTNKGTNWSADVRRDADESPPTSPCI